MATIARATARLAATWSGSSVLDSEQALDHEPGLVGIGVDDGPASEHDIDAHLSLAAWVWNMAAHALVDLVAGARVADVASELLRHHHRAENDVRTGRADEVRLALRVTSRLQRLLASNAVVVVDVGGHAIRVGDNESVVLRDIPAWAQIAWCLTTAAIENAPVDAAALIAAGWPNEQLQDTVAAGYLAEALAGIRDAGLEQMLVVDDDGYRLSALVLVRSPTV